MRSIRKLYLQNADGERYGLNGESGIYASDLAGFGFTLSPVFADLSRGFFIPVSDESEPQGTIPFTLTFTKAPYVEYQKFVDWLNATQTLTVIYIPTGTKEYWRDVNINFLQKGELNAVGWLEVPCSFYVSTPWYLPTPTSLYLEAAWADESKRYDYYYDDDLIYGEDSSSAMTGIVQGAGHIPGSLELTFYGAITNPRIRLVGNVTGKTYGICSVAVVLSEGDRLKFSSRYENSYVKRITAAGVETDLLDVLDLSLTPFFHIPVNEPCTVSIEADAAFTGKADLLIYYYFRSV